MTMLNYIREKNKNNESFLNTKITEHSLSQKEFTEGRKIFLKFVKPINEKSFCNYLKNKLNLKL